MLSHTQIITMSGDGYINLLDCYNPFTMYTPVKIMLNTINIYDLYWSVIPQ